MSFLLQGGRMGFLEILIIGVGLSMDAFAVSICKGLSTRTLKLKHALICGGYFGFFQGFMPFLGYVLGIQFKDKIESIDHWIAFILLGLIGINMIREGNEEVEKESEVSSISYRNIFLLAIATSIDALAVGVSFAFLNVNILYAVIIIAVTTFVLSFFSVLLGKTLGSMFQKYAELLGGIILILLGIKILIEHLFF